MTWFVDHNQMVFLFIHDKSNILNEKVNEF